MTVVTRALLPRQFLARAFSSKANTIKVDGNSLKLNELIALGDFSNPIELTADAWTAVQASRNVIETVLENDQVVYGM